MKKLTVIFSALLIVANVLFGQNVQELYEYENKSSSTGQTIDVSVEDHVRLYYETESNFSYQYTTGNGDYLHAKLGKVNYPTVATTVIPTENKETISSRPCKDDKYIVGSIAGKHSVGADGSTNYTIPIKVVPGTNGATPQLALVYNSHSGNSIAGWGWSLSGTSVISRVPKNKYDDNEIKDIEFTSNDKLALDGNRLVQIEGSIGSNDAVFAPKVGNSIRVYPENSAGYGYTSFTVQNKNGTLLEYGKTSNSRFETERGIFVWNINKITDPNGNYITYEYGKQFGEMFLKKINYTGNAAAGLAPYASVELIYETRNNYDNNTLYINGITLNQSIILKKVLVKYRNDIVHTYELDYINDANYLQLYRLIEKGEEDGVNTVRYNSTIFEYYAQSGNEKRAAIPLASQAIPELITVDPNDIIEYFGDFNGDKISDKVIIDISNGHSTDWYMQFGQYYDSEDAGEFETNSEYLKENGYSFVDPPVSRYQFYTCGAGIVSQRLLLNLIQIVDINQDGYDDVIIPYLDDRFDDIGDNVNDLPPVEERYKKLKIRIDTSDGTRLNFATDFTVYEGRLNYVVDGGFAECYTYMSDITMRENIIVGDFDGDSNLELIIHAKEYEMHTTTFIMGCNEYYGDEHYHKLYYCDISKVQDDGKGYINIFPTTIHLKDMLEEGENYNVNAQLFALNFNGDKKTDLLVAIDDNPDNDKGIYELNSTCDGLNKLLTCTHPANFFYYPGDFNGDGLTDLFYYSHTGDDDWKIKYGTNGGFTESEQVSEFTFGKPEPIVELFKDIPYVLDFNGDGKTDILWYTYNDGTGPRIYHFFHSNGMNKFHHSVYYYEESYWELNKDIYWDQGILYQRRNNFIDFSGDGTYDFYNAIDRPLQVGGAEHHILTFNFEDQDLRLMNVYNGFNTKTNFKYEPLSKGVNVSGEAEPYKHSFTTDYPLLTLKGGGYVTSSIEQYASDDHTSLVSQTKYQYEDALVHREGKGFLGFKKTIVSIPELDGTNEVNTVTELSLNSEIYALLNPVQYSYINSNLTTQIQTTNSVYDLLNDRYLIKTDQVDNFVYVDGTLSNRSRTTYTMNTFGDPTLENNLLGDPSSPIMSITKQYQYGNEDESISWCNANRLVRRTITQDHEDDTGLNYIRVTDYDYSDDDYCRLNKITFDPNKTKKVDVFLEHDKFGNVSKKTIKQYEDSNIQDRFSSMKYDDQGRFLTVKKDALSNVERFENHQYFGSVLKKTDMSGTSILYEYNGLGDLMKEIIPTLNDSYIEYKSEWAKSEDPDGTIFTSTLTGTDMSGTTKYFDAMGRDFIAEQTKYFPQQTIRVKKEFKLDGRVTKETSPYNKDIYTEDDPPKYVTYSYDDNFEMDALTTVNESTGINQTVNFDKQFNTKSVETPDGNISTETYDLAGFLVVKEDPMGNSIKYKYHNNGSIKEVKTVGLDTEDALTIQLMYDDYGRQQWLIDRDAGTQHYYYNAFGELIQQTMPTGTIKYDYDILGRLVNKELYESQTANTVEYDFNYNTSGNGIGQIKSIISSDGINKRLYYNELGFVEKSVDEIHGKEFEYDFTYYDNGQLNEITYPAEQSINRVKIKNEYNEYSYTERILRTDDNPSGDEMWEQKQIDEFGRIREYSLTNDVLTSQFTYNDNDNLTGIKTFQIQNTSNIIQDLAYVYWEGKNETNLMKIRNDKKNNQYEEFWYDDLYRLEHYEITDNSGSEPTMSPIDMTYHLDGSISSKTLVGKYYYNSNPSTRGEIEDPAHAVKGVTPGLVNQPNHTITYNAFNSIRTIEENEKKSEYYYDVNGQRVKMVYMINNVPVYTKYYLGSYELVVNADVSYKETTYVNGFAAITRDDLGQENTYYTHTDHLGSLQSITDNSGNLIPGAEFSFDPWGNLRGKDNWTVNYIQDIDHPQFGLFNRGFTGHEHMVEFGLINMNGRVYDQRLGQFFQPDNYIQAPGFSQSYNRFSYCINNPLLYTDPSGELFGIDDGIILAISLTYAISSITYNTWETWNNYGQQAALTNLTTNITKMGINIITAAVSGKIYNTYGGFQGLDGTSLGALGTSHYRDPKTGQIWICPEGALVIKPKPLGFWEGVADGVLLGIRNTVEASVMVLWDHNYAANEINNTVDGVSYAVSNPGETFDAISERIQNMNSYDWGVVFGEFAPTVASLGLTSLYWKVPTTIGDISAKSVIKGTHVVYTGIDKNGVVRYVGITKRTPTIRFAEHLNSTTKKSLLKFRVIDGATDLSKTSARVMEQNLINKYGLQKMGGQLFNKRNSISKKYWEQLGIK